MFQVISTCWSYIVYFASFRLAQWYFLYSVQPIPVPQLDVAEITEIKIAAEMNAKTVIAAAW